MLVESNQDYRGYRLEVNAVVEVDRWNADVRIRQHAVNAKPHVETVTTLKLRADHAEHGAMT